MGFNPQWQVCTAFASVFILLSPGKVRAGVWGRWCLTVDKRENLSKIQVQDFFLKNATYKWNQQSISFREMSGIVVTKTNEVISGHLQTSRRNFINMKNRVPHGEFF